MSIIKIVGSTLVVLLVIVGSNSAWAVYKWTDKHNVIHYDQFPPKNQKAKKIKTKNQKGNFSQTKSIPSTKTTVPKEASEEPRPSTQTKTKAIAYREDCAKAKRNLQILSNNQRIRIQDHGNYRVLSEQERQEQINGIKKKISGICQHNPQQHGK
jgi:catalase